MFTMNFYEFNIYRRLKIKINDIYLFSHDHLKAINIYINIKVVFNASNKFILKFRYS